MNRQELAELCRKMRTLQKLYFRTRGQQTLEDCREAERELDRVLETILDNPKDLFSGREP